MTNEPPLTIIQRLAAASLSKALAASERERTAFYRETAERFIDARGHFFNKHGEPDWNGRTYAYRTWVREVLSLAHVPPAELNTVTAALRYHSGNVLRERLDGDELEALGLRKTSPRQWSVDRRSKHSATLALFGAGGPELTDAGAIVTAANMMDAVLRRVSLDAVASMAPGDRHKIRDAVERVRDAAEAVAGSALAAAK